MQHSIPRLSDRWNSSSTVLSDDQSLAHQMHVFRMRLLHFVNSLHDYIMTRVITVVVVVVTLSSVIL